MPTPRLDIHRLDARGRTRAFDGSEPIPLDRLVALPRGMSLAALLQRCRHDGRASAVVRVRQAPGKGGASRLLLLVPLRRPAGFVAGLLRTRRRVAGATEWAALATAVASEGVSSEDFAALQRRFRHNEQRLAVAVRSLQAGIWDWSIRDGRVIYIPWENEGARPTYFETHAQTWGQQVHPDDRELASQQVAAALAGRADSFRTLVRQRVASHHDYRIVESRGTVLERDAAGMPLRFVGTYVDVTERVDAERRMKEREAVLARNARLASLGELASGLAHELNQPLSALLAYLSVAQRLSTAGGRRVNPELSTALTESSRMAMRVADTLGRVRGIVRRAPPQADQYDLHELVRETVDSATRANPDPGVMIRIEPSRDPALGRMHGDVLQVGLLLANLLRNAIDACGESGKEVVITTARDGAYAAITVADNGPGIAPEHGARLFEPFFTTKPTGTGLGLPISRSIAEAHGGSLRLLDGSPGRCTFMCRLPLTVEARSA
jgi:signal transduction histidine kinase